MAACHLLRVHLEQQIEDEEQRDSLVKDLQEHIQKAYAEEIQDRDVLRGSYITRILRLRKVNTSATRLYQRKTI